MKQQYNTKLIFLNGKKRLITYIGKNNYIEYISSWYNMDNNGNLICEECNEKMMKVKNL